MKIIGKSAVDYYDGVAGQFADHESGNMFNRTQQHLEIWNRSSTGPRKKSPWSFMTDSISNVDRKSNTTRDSFTGAPLQFYFETFNLLVCGKVYRGIQVKDQYTTQHFYTPESFGAFIAQHEISTYTEKRRLWKGGGHTDIRGLHILCSADWVNLFSVTDKHDFAIENKVVLAVTHWDMKGWGLTINPTLKNYSFFKVMDAYTIFQELSMFVDGMLSSPGNVLIEIADEYKKEAHGFGHKYAFKREPTKIK